MTQALFLASRSAAVGVPVVDGVQAVAINLVSTDDAPTVIAAAIAKLNAQSGKADAFAPGYFDTVVTLGDLSGGPLNGNNKAMVFGAVSNLAPPPAVLA